MARLYADENFEAEVVHELRQLGHNVVSVSETGRAGDPDNAELRFATNEQRAVLTHDRLDFRRLHRQISTHSGNVICTNDPDFAALAQRIDHAILAAGDLSGKLISVVRTP